jgi:uncharacterized protein
MNSPGQPTSLISRGWIRAMVFCICYLLVFIIAGSIYTRLRQGINISTQAFFFWGFIVSFFFAMLTVYVFRRVIDRQSFMSLGFEWEHHKRDAAEGLLLGLSLLGIESLILYFTGHLTWTGVTVNITDLFSGIIIMLLVAVAEETVFRGYILNNLLQSINKWLALGISSLLFALFHAGNPAITMLALLNIFLSGLVLGLNYLYTKNLWFAIMFHFSWNFFLGPVLGYEVSGLGLSSLLEQDIAGPDWLTGGEFGLEGSILDGIFSIVAFILLATQYNKPTNDPMT